MNPCQASTAVDEQDDPPAYHDVWDDHDCDLEKDHDGDHECECGFTW